MAEMTGILNRLFRRILPLIKPFRERNEVTNAGENEDTRLEDGNPWIRRPDKLELDRTLNEQVEEETVAGEIKWVCLWQSNTEV